MLSEALAGFDFKINIWMDAFYMSNRKDGMILLNPWC